MFHPGCFSSWEPETLVQHLENLPWDSLCCLQWLRWAGIHPSSILDWTAAWCSQFQATLAEGSNKMQLPGHQLVHPETTHVMAPYWEEVGIAIKPAAFPEHLLPVSDLMYASVTTCYAALAVRAPCRKCYRVF